MSPCPPLTDRERDVLDLERGWWRWASVKETAIRDRLAMTTTQYYQLLNELIDRESGLAHDPLLVRRLRRQRLARQRERSARRTEADTSS